MDTNSTQLPSSYFQSFQQDLQFDDTRPEQAWYDQPLSLDHFNTIQPNMGMGNEVWDYYSPLFPDPQLPVPFDDFSVLSANTRPLEPLVLPAPPSHSREIVPVDVTSTSRASPLGDYTASTHGSTASTLGSTASHPSAELMGTTLRLTPRRTASQLLPTLTISPGPGTSRASSEEEGSTTLRLPVVPVVPALLTMNAPQRFMRNLWDCPTPTPDSDFFTDLGPITSSTSPSVNARSSSSGLPDWSSSPDTPLDDFPHIPDGYMDDLYIERFMQKYVDPFIGTAMPVTTTTNKRKESPSSDSESDRSSKKMKTSTTQTNDSTPNGVEDSIRWATPVVQQDNLIELGASASEDGPTYNNLPRFQPGVATRPAEGPSTGKKATKPKRAAKPKKATIPSISCPIASCNKKFGRNEELHRHICTNKDTHPQIRNVPGWERRYGVPDDFKGKLMACPFPSCEHRSKIDGMRRYEVDKHMRAHHGGMNVTMWLERVAMFEQWEDEDFDEDLFDWCFRYVFW